jgi:hypothetical protein
VIRLETNDVRTLRMPPSEQRTRLAARMTLSDDQLFGIPNLAVQQLRLGLSLSEPSHSACIMADNAGEADMPRTEDYRDLTPRSWRRAEIAPAPKERVHLHG